MEVDGSRKHENTEKRGLCYEAVGTLRDALEHATD